MIAATSTRNYLLFCFYTYLQGSATRDDIKFIPFLLLSGNSGVFGHPFLLSILICIIGSYSWLVHIYECSTERESFLYDYRYRRSTHKPAFKNCTGQEPSTVEERRNVRLPYTAYADLLDKPRRL